MQVIQVTLVLLAIGAALAAPTDQDADGTQSRDARFFGMGGFGMGGFGGTLLTLIVKNTFVCGSTNAFWFVV